MRVESTPQFITGFTLNRATGELEQVKINWTEMMENAAALREAKAELLAASKKSLSSKEIDALAERLYQKYDPKHMSQDDFIRFINDLVDGGALDRAETECMDGRVIVDPTAPGGLVQVRPGENFAWSLAEADGDAMIYLLSLLRRYNSGTQADEANSDAVRKAAAVLDAIIKQRERSGL